MCVLVFTFMFDVCGFFFGMAFVWLKMSRVAQHFCVVLDVIWGPTTFKKHVFWSPQNLKQTVLRIDTHAGEILPLSVGAFLTYRNPPSAHGALCFRLYVLIS